VVLWLKQIQKQVWQAPLSQFGSVVNYQRHYQFNKYGIIKRHQMIEFKHSGTELFWNYWRAMARDGLIPESRNFFPEEVPSLLPFFLYMNSSLKIVFVLNLQVR